MLYLDKEFVYRLKPYLDHFTQKSDYLYNFRCPLCSDSRKSKSKARGYIYRNDNNLFFHCHNCNVSLSLRNLLKEINHSLYQEYLMESLKERGLFEEVKDAVTHEVIEPLVFGKDIPLPTIASLPFSHPAKTYLKHRQISPVFWNDLYYASDFADFTHSTLENFVRKLPENDKRIVIPLRDENKNLLGWQGRSLFNHEIRYITIKTNEANRKVYGLDRLDKNQQIRVVEGPFDSMFLNNCVASIDSNLLHIVSTIDCAYADYLFVFDNEKRNKELHIAMRKVLKKEYPIVIWPEYLEQKDINEMVLAGVDVEKMITNRTFQGMRAKLEFEQWIKT